MAANWEKYLERWAKAGLIEASTADRVRAYETGQEKVRGLKWPILIAIAFGGLLLAAGVLLLVAAHWETVSPVQRFILVLALVAVMHIGGATAAARFGALSTTFHAVGTICLGAGIFLTGQIFNLQEHWPAGIMLWALGAWVAWVFLRDWPQAGLVAVLTPAWLAGEWSEATEGLMGNMTVVSAGLLMAAVSYLTASQPEEKSAVRKTLLWIGGIALIPSTLSLVMSGKFGYWQRISLPWHYQVFGWAAAFLLPLALSLLFRGKRAWLNVVAGLWVVALSLTSLRSGMNVMLQNTADDLGVYAVCALGAVGLIAWGMKEGGKERVNLGIAGFALTVLAFYFSSVMDKLGRSASLIGLGLLFLLGGWLLEKTRRRLLIKMAGGAL